MRLYFMNLPMLLAPALLMAAGCGGVMGTANSSNVGFSVTPGASSIDTNCTGCNATGANGALVHQFAATQTNGSPAEVTWSVSGGDATSGPGSINANGQYTPPSYLTASPRRAAQPVSTLIWQARQTDKAAGRVLWAQ